MKEKILKKGITRRLFSVVLAVAMVLSLIPLNNITVYANDASWESIKIDSTDYLYDASVIRIKEDSLTRSLLCNACGKHIATYAEGAWTAFPEEFNPCLSAGHIKAEEVPTYEEIYNMLDGVYYGQVTDGENTENLLSFFADGFRAGSDSVLNIALLLDPSKVKKTIVVSVSDRTGYDYKIGEYKNTDLDMDYSSAYFKVVGDKITDICCTATDGKIYTLTARTTPCDKDYAGIVSMLGDRIYESDSWQIKADNGVFTLIMRPDYIMPISEASFINIHKFNNEYLVIANIGDPGAMVMHTNTAGTIITEISFFGESLVCDDILPDGASWESIKIDSIDYLYDTNSIENNGYSLNCKICGNPIATYADGEWTAFQTELDGCLSAGHIKVKTTHKHTWSYSVENGPTLVATCTCNDQTEGYGSCAYKEIAADADGRKVSLTLSASDADYSGSDAYTGAILENLDAFKTATGLTTTPTINYYKVDTEGATTGGTQKNAAEVRKTVGNYYASVSIEGKTAVKAFKIYENAQHTTHDGIEFQPWVPADHDGALLPNVAGSWYLTDNVTVNTDWNVPEDTTNLCLNGKMLSLSGCRIRISESATLNLYDCGNDAHEGYLDNYLWTRGTGGEGTTAKTIYGGIIYPEYFGEWNQKANSPVQVDGTFTMYGGTIAGVTDSQGWGYSAAVKSITPGKGHFNMYGGAITGNVYTNGMYFANHNLNYGIIDPGKLESFTVGKNAVIDENYVIGYETVGGVYTPVYAKGNVIISDTKVIQIDTGDYAPTEKMRVGVRSVTAPVLGAPVVFTGANAGENDASRFESNMEGIQIERRKNNALYLCVADEASYVPHECVDHKEKQNGQAETCTEDGWNDYYKCTTCETLYSDEAMTTEITDLEAWKTGDGKIEKTGHSWTFTANGNTLTATCNRDASHTATLTLTATSASHSVSPITKETLFSGVGFTTFNTATKLTLTLDDIKLYAKSDTSKLTALTEITANGWYVAELTVTTDKTARLEFPVGDIKTVTYNANGHGTAPAGTMVLNDEKLIAPTNPTASGYTFAGWYKEAACTSAWNFNTDTVTENITLYAKWNQNSGSGGGGGYTPPSNPDNNNSGNNNSGNTITVPVENGSQSSKVTIEIKDNVAVVDTISDDVIKDTVEKGTTDTITIDASAANTDVHGTALDKQTAEKIADVIKDTSNKVENLEIKTPQATIKLDGTALQTVADAAGAATDLITLVVDDVNNVMNELTSVQQNAIKDTKPLATFDAYILAGKSRVHDLKGGVMTVAVEYPFPNTVSAKNVKLVHMLNDGGTEVLEWKVVTENGKKLMVFNTKSLSYFTFTLDENGVLVDTEQEASEAEDTVITPEVAAANALTMNAALRVNQTGNRINVSWGKVEGADGYVVYAAYCGTKLAKIETIADADTTSLEIAKLDGKKLDLKKSYKVRVVAYKLVDGKKTRIGKTIIAHVAGRKSTKYTNAKSIMLTSAGKVTLKAGKTAKIKATIVPVNAEKKQLSDAHAKEFRYASSDTSIATVNANGKITAKKEGKCTIYVYAKNGYSKKVTVTVK